MPKTASQDVGFCPECELPLLHERQLLHRLRCLGPGRLEDLEASEQRTGRHDTRGGAGMSDPTQPTHCADAGYPAAGRPGGSGRTAPPVCSHGHAAPGLRARPPGYPPRTTRPRRRRVGAAPPAATDQAQARAHHRRRGRRHRPDRWDFAVINLTKDKEDAGPTTPASVGGHHQPRRRPGPGPAGTPATVPGPTTPPSVVTTDAAAADDLAADDVTADDRVDRGVTPRAVFGSIAVTVPYGWEVGTAADGFVALGTEGAAVYITALPFNGDAQQLGRRLPPGVGDGAAGERHSRR